MPSILTIVMYHYVRDLAHSRYPDIKGLDLERFKGQIQYIKRHYHVISGPDLMNCIIEGAPLPARPLLLTFDDAYSDHFTDVFPILDRENLPGCFFPPARCILEHTVLDVNKIHFVLAAVSDKRTLVEHISRRVDEERSHYDLPPAATYWERLGKPDRFDTAEVLFCKRMLQRDLPTDLRNAIANELFHRFVTGDEASFSHELYMQPEQIEMLQKHGMYVGSHGYDHFWLNTLSPAQQER